MLKPVEKQRLSNQVFNQLRDNILNQEYMPGERLPSERELCDIMHINRSSVREALKRLEQARLIEIRHGEGSVVLDFQYSAGFDLLRHLVEPNGRVNYLTIRSLCEIRAVMCVEIARLAALRIQAPELERLRSIVDDIEACSSGEVRDFQDLDFDFHYTMAQASENVAFLLMFNSTRDIYLPIAQSFEAMFDHVLKAPEIYRSIYEAVAAHDQETAAELCSQLIQEGNKIYLKMYEDSQK